ncbi:MAG: hypothetical protein KKC05_01750 [Nanoarchaeota archaeon]|nr:hypothetical protein [Nanoarchaeota archaeon]
MTFKICLIGSIPKGDEERKNWIDWKIKYKEGLSSLGEIEFLDGDTWKNEANTLLTFGYDTNQIKTSDVVIVNAENKLGAGTSQEMVIAKYFSKPVITILPKDTHHRKSNITFNKTLIKDWIHPFILTMSDLIVDKISDACDWIKEYQKDPSSKKIKKMTIVDEAIEYYKKQEE